MGLTTGALELGKSALLSYQSALQVIGNNIANAGVDGYVRQTPRLTTLQGVPLPEGLLSGGGMGLTNLQRHLDEALESRLRSAMSNEQNYTAQQQALSAIESVYNELSDTDLSSQLGAFFSAFAAVQNTPEDPATRDQALTAGQTLAGLIQHMRSELTRMHDQLNDQIIDSTDQANDLAQQVADLNLEIVRAESTGHGQAASLRDQRDGVLKELSKLMDIQTSETSEGAVNVYIGNEPLVQYAQSRGLRADREQVGDRTIVNVHFADNSGTVKITSGQIAGQLVSRDRHIYGQIQQLDRLASNLIHQVNRIHSQGQGLAGYSDITGTYDVLDADAALNSSAAGLAFAPASGSFKLTIINSTSGLPKTYDIPISLPTSGGGTSLNDLVSYINANVEGVTATASPTNCLQITADAGNTVTFGEDTSGVLASLGMNTYFSGTSASDIAVRAELVDHQEFLAASSNGQPGDGGNAGAISALADDRQAVPGSQSIPAQWRSIIAALATTSGTARNSGEASHNVSQSLQAQRESVSGVNTDEEAVRLMSYQRSFQAAARYISLVDQLVDEMLSMVR